MDSFDISKELQRLPASNWQTVKGHNGQVNIYWLPIFTSPQYVGPTIGISINAEWVSVSQHGVQKLTTPGASTAWLLAFEYSLNTFQTMVNRRAKEHGLAFELADYLPYETILNEGLDYGNDAMNNLVLKWLETDPLLITEGLRQRLITLSNDRFCSQNIRHRAAKLSSP